uniref:Lectizyme n=1 Tax=Glossina austeni TaxID=7395 RepID=A0A1A9VQB9_GLOAU
MHLKQIFSVKLLFSVILATGLIKSSNADENNETRHVCNISGEPRRCVPHAWCKSDRNVIHFYDDQCDRDPNGIRLVCCLQSHLLVPKVDKKPKIAVDLPKDYLARKKCDDYYRPIDGLTHGEKVLKREFPFMFALGWKAKNDNATIVYKCGASFIAARYVLTAAHCFYDNDGLPSVVRAGGISLADNDVQNIEIAECIEHPDYEYPSSYNDIALVKLAEYREPASMVEPAACLPDYNGLQAHDNVIVLGYGQTSFAGIASEDLLKATLKVYPQSQCEQDYPPDELSRNLRNGISENFICAIDPENLRDTCQGDSGGPLVKVLVDRPYIFGVTSFGVGCASGMPGIYTSVAEYMPWIEKIIWPDVY